MSTEILRVFAWRYRGQLILIGVLTIATSLATLVIPWLAAQLLGGILVAADSLNASMIVALAVLLVVIACLTMATSIVSASVSSRIMADIRLDVHDHVFRLPMPFLDQARGGDLLSLMTFEVSALSSFLTSTLATVPAQLLTAGGAVFLLFAIDPGLALVVPILLPAFFILCRLVGRRLRELGAQVRQAEATVIVTAETNLDLTLTIKSFATENRATRTFDVALERARDVAVRQARITSVLAPLTGLLAGLAAIALVLLAGERIASGENGPEELFGFLLYTALLTRPIGALASVYGRVQVARGTLARLNDLLSVPHETGGTHRLPQRIAGKVEFADVTFNYPGRSGVLLSGASFAISRGETIALTGPNGGGKTTLIRLLLGLYRPDRGQILIDGQDIADLDLHDLRRRIGLVPQHPELFHGTIRENVIYSLPQASEADIERALDLAQAREFVAALPEGLSTEIGDHGALLSGGQRQRIALARTLLVDPAILVLDEATSMFDSRGEADFVQDCQDAFANRTVIIIAHRPATLALADRTFRVDDGKVMEITP